jgi:nitrogen-specific signal transduction histidine kinase/CheY-like chemotaxis protein
MTDAIDARSRRLRAERIELIGWLAGAVAHDVNNVLTAIAGYAELIEADLDPQDPHAADTAGIRDAVLRAVGLVRQLITVGRRQTLRLETLDASDLVQGLVPLLTSACGDRIRVQSEACGEPALVLADRSLLEQALLNLAINARDAMPDGGTLTVAVSISPRLTETAAAHAGDAIDRAAQEAAPPLEDVRIAVADTGAGIEAAVLPHVFEPYFSTKDRGRGSGVGLTSVEEAAAQSGGVVSVESRVGEGSRFTLHLPRIAANPVQTPVAAVSGRAHGGTETILFVDADPEVRLVLARILRRLGYSVVDAATPRQALALAEYGIDRLDLLVTETSLAELSGPELAARVRALHPGVPVLFLSRDARGTRTPPGAMPGDRMLAKPVTAERLGVTLRAALDARPANGVDRRRR